MKASHYIEVYKDSKGNTKVTEVCPIELFIVLGMAVINWKPIAVFKIKKLG